MRNSRSRLSRNLESQSKKQLVLSILGIIIVLFLLLKYGIYVIDGIGTLTLGYKNDNAETNVLKASVEVIPPPDISNIPPAINTDKLDISGKVLVNKGTIELYLNNESYSEKEINGDTFKFSGIQLKEGQNTIKTRQKVDDKSSEFSKEYEIVYEKEPPKLEVSSPSDGTNFGKGDQQIEVVGKVDPNYSVTINGYRATVDGNGIFSYYLRLNDGENTITTEVTSLTGLKTKEERKVTYSP